MTRRILWFVFSTAALLAPAWAATNDIPSPVIGKSVRQEFGTLRGDYFVPGRLVGDQVMMGRVIPNPPKLLPEGNTLISGCRRHSCDEKSAVIVTPAGTMLAAGLIHFRCTRQDCDSAAHLTIFMKKKNDRPDFVQELHEWAVRQGYKGGAAETKILP